MKKLLTLLLCFIMLITSAMIPTPVSAAYEYTPEEKEAAEKKEEPKQIEHPHQIMIE